MGPDILTNTTIDSAVCIGHVLDLIIGGSVNDLRRISDLETYVLRRILDLQTF